MGHRCTGEAIDPDGEALICIRHYAAAVRTVDAAKAVITSPAARVAGQSHG